MLFPILGIAAAGLVLALFSSSGTSPTLFNVFAAILGLGAVISAVVLGLKFLFSYCRAAEKVTNGELTYRFNVWMAVLLNVVGGGFLWTVLVQYHFNRIRPATAVTGPAPIADPSHSIQ